MSEVEFYNWVKKEFPEVFPICFGDIEVVYTDVELKNIGFDVIPLFIDHNRDKKSMRIYLPDYKLYSRDSLAGICWVDVKRTSYITENEYNLNYQKYVYYRYVSEKTNRPAYLVIYEGENKHFSYWLRVDIHKNVSVPTNLPCEEGETFKDEIKTLIDKT